MVGGEEAFAQAVGFQQMPEVQEGVASGTPLAASPHHCWKE